jgi:MFS family permease
MIGLPLSSVIGGPISGWIMGHFDQVHGLHGWQWLFLLEAIPSVLLGILTFWALPNHFQQAKWLSADDKAQLAAPGRRRCRGQGQQAQLPRWLLQPEGVDARWYRLFDPAQRLCDGLLDADLHP